MALQKNTVMSLGWPVFGIGVAVTAIGGSLLTVVGVHFLNQAIRGKPVETMGGLTVLTVVGGICLLGGGFLAMVYSAIQSDGEAGSVAASFSGHRQGNEDAAGQSTHFFGPPKPIVVIRCQRCKTLNNEHHGTCIRCDQLL